MIFIHFCVDLSIAIYHIKYNYNVHIWLKLKILCLFFCEFSLFLLLSEYLNNRQMNAFPHLTHFIYTYFLWQRYFFSDKSTYIFNDFFIYNVTLVVRKYFQVHRKFIFKLNKSHDTLCREGRVTWRIVFFLFFSSGKNSIILWYFLFWIVDFAMELFARCL